MIYFEATTDDNIYNAMQKTNKYDFDKKLGELHYNQARKVWVFYEGNGYTDGSKEDPTGVDYYRGLKDTEDELKADFESILES